MKNILKIFRTSIFLLISLATIACTVSLSEGTDGKRCTMKLRFSSEGRKTILPTFNAPNKFRITISGGPTPIPPIENDSGEIQVALEYGKYDFLIEGFDSDSKKTCEGIEKDVEVHSPNLVHLITMFPLYNEGTGNVSISIKWPTASGVTRIETSFVLISESDSFSDSAIADNEASFSSAIPSGNYRLGIKAWRGAALICSRIEIMQVSGGLTTSASIFLDPRDIDFSDIDCGNDFTIALKSDGSLWSWGSNSEGQLGNGTRNASATPIRIAESRRWIAISAEGEHAMAISVDGSLWGWGKNSGNIIADGSIMRCLTPMQIGNSTDWKGISVGTNHACAIKTDGSLWTWGLGSKGELGNGLTSSSENPTKMNAETDWLKAIAGYSFTIALKENGTLWAWGYNNYGQLGNGTLNNSIVPIQVGNDNSWKEIAAGESHVMGIKSDGSLWGWGNSSNYQLGDGTTNSQNTPKQIRTSQNWAKIFTTRTHSFGVDSNNSIWGWGKKGYGPLDDYGMLGNGLMPPDTNPIHIGSTSTIRKISQGNYFSIFLLQNGEIFSCGINESGQLGIGYITKPQSPSPISQDPDWKQVSTGDYFSAAIKNDGSLWTWGSNSTGGLGIGPGIDLKAKPASADNGNNWAKIQVGTKHCIALKADGTLWNWGNYDYVIPSGGTKFYPCQIDNSSNWKDISLKQGLSIAIGKDGTLWTWGNNYYGQLGTGSDNTGITQTPTQVGTDSDWYIAVSAGDYAFAAKTNGTWWRWGRNDFGQLCDGTLINKKSPIAMDSSFNWAKLSLSSCHAIALRDDGTIWEWGSIRQNQNSIKQSTPIRIGNMSNWTSICGDNDYFFAINEYGELWSCGQNGSGQLGLGNTDNYYELSKVGTDLDWKDIQTSFSHIIALKNNGTLWAWGSTANGASGTGFYVPTITDFSVYE